MWKRCLPAQLINCVLLNKTIQTEHMHNEEVIVGRI